MVRAGEAGLTVFDAAGRRVAAPLVLSLGPGLQRLHWSPEGSLPSGVYFLRLHTSGFTETHKLLLVR